MGANPRNLLLFAILAGGALLTFLLARVSADRDAATADPGAAPQGYYLLGAVIHRTDDEGGLAYRILAERVEQEAEGADFVFEGMRVEYTPDANVRWDVSAARGFADADHDALRLTEGVRLVYAAEADQDETIFETNELHLDAGAYFASTNQPVTMRKGRLSVTAKGLELDLDTDEWRLGSNDSDERDVTIRQLR